MKNSLHFVRMRRLLAEKSRFVMGVLNITPDSFYGESRFSDLEEVIKIASKMLEDGCDILDIGAMSSRPGAKVVSPEDELNRLKEIFMAVRDHFPEAYISIDTVHAKTAEFCLSNGADMINDISAGSIDPELRDVVAQFDAPYCLMHMQKRPETMQNDPEYDNVCLEVLNFFQKQLDQLQAKGINNIILDPGFGFGKTIEHNYQILNHLGLYKMFDLPILAGLSRKSMIYKLLNITPEEALPATTALNLKALQNGTSILRVHDVKQAVEVIKLHETLENSNH